MIFCSKISFFLFLKVIPMLFLKRCYTFMLLNLSNLAHPGCKNLLNWPVTWNKENKEVNTIKPRKQKVQNKERVPRFLHRGRPSNLHTVVLILSTKECMSSWLTNVHSRCLNKCTFSASLNSPFMSLVFLHQIHRPKVKKKNCFRKSKL